MGKWMVNISEKPELKMNINEITFIDEKELAPIIDLEIRIDEMRLDLVRKQNELRRTLIQLRRKLGLKMSDKIDLSQGIAIPIEKAMESNGAEAAK